jgi:hypothetical protein
MNLMSKKYKTKYTALIGELIDKEYEIRLQSENKICERCAVLIEKYDELQHETKTVKSILSRQIAHTYSIETSEEMVYMDKSKTFIELNGKNQNCVKYSCKLCPRYVTENIDTVNTHIMYHKIMIEGQIQTNELRRDLTLPPKRNHPIGREIPTKKPEATKPTQQHQVVQTPKIEILEVEQKIKHEPPIEISAMDIRQQEFDEETLDSLIDLDLLADQFYDSNIKNRECMVTGCTMEFAFVTDYIRHLRLKHKSSLNHVFAVIRANIKRPSKLNKFMCPYCFTKTANSQSLEQHVKEHDDASKASVFNDRLRDFVDNVMASSRCNTCDCEVIDPTVLECNHEIAKNGLAPKLNCMFCSRLFYNDKLYNNHLALEHGHCFICNASCEEQDLLADHIRSHLT